MLGTGEKTRGILKLIFHRLHDLLMASHGKCQQRSRGPSGFKRIVDTDSGHVYRTIYVCRIIHFLASKCHSQMMSSPKIHLLLRRLGFRTRFRSSTMHLGSMVLFEVTYMKRIHGHQLYMFVDVFPLCRNVDDSRDMLNFQSLLWNILLTYGKVDSDSCFKMICEEV